MSRSNRHLELDLLRSLAIAMMVVFHVAFDLQYFAHWNIDTSVGAWRLFERVTANLFLLLVGVSFAVSWGRSAPRADGTRRIDTVRALYPKYLRRGLVLLGWAALISLVTYVMAPQEFIRFGVLHLIGVSALLLPFFTGLGEWNALVALVFLTGWLSSDWGLPKLLLPLFPTRFDTLDYFPLFPWFGTVLIGEAIGAFLYVRHAWRWNATSRCLDLLSQPGRYSLMIYLLHQPVLLGILWLTRVT